MPRQMHRAGRPRNRRGGTAVKQRDVIFKGTGRSLKVVLSEGAKMEDALLSIEEKLAANPTFYAGHRITVESKAGAIPDDASDRIRAVFARYGLSCSVDDRKGAAEKAAAMITQTALSDEEAVLLKGTARSVYDKETAEVLRGDVVPGRSLSFEGSVLILGDVLPGARVLAGGDIIVTGVACGHLHAGWPSDEAATIIAGGFASAECAVGAHSLKVQDAIGSSVTMYSVSYAQGGLEVRTGEAGMLSRRGRRG